MSFSASLVCTVLRRSHRVKLPLSSWVLLLHPSDNLLECLAGCGVACTGLSLATQFVGRPVFALAGYMAEDLEDVLDGDGFCRTLTVLWMKPVNMEIKGIVDFPGADTSTALEAFNISLE